MVGTHAHVLLGAGMLNDTYVSYGLGNFLWYHGRPSDTGVLRVQIVDGKITRDDWVPGKIRPTGGPPRPVTGSARSDAIKEWRDLAAAPTSRPDQGKRRLLTVPAAAPAATQQAPVAGVRSGFPRTPRPSSPFRAPSSSG